MVVVVVATACGGSTTPGAAPSAAGASPASAASAAPAKAVKLVIGWSSADAIYGPWFYAQDKGYWTKHNIDSDFVFFDSGAKAIQALVGGAADVTTGDGNSMINARFGGTDIKAIGVTLSVLTGNVYAAKDVTNPSQLKGKKWGISSFGSEADIAARLALTSFKLEPDKDVTIVQVGNQGNRLAALDAAQIQVTTFLPPIASKAEAAGYKKLAQLPDLAPDYFSVGPTVLGKTLTEKRAALKEFLKGLAEATAAYRADRAGGVAVIQKYLKVDNIADAQAAFDYYAPLEPPTLRPTDKSIQFLLDRNQDPKAKTAKPAEFLDLTLLDELQKEGFFSNLK